MPFLAVTAVAAERDAVRQAVGTPGQGGRNAWDVLAVGAGPAAAAAGTAVALTRAALAGRPYGLVVSAGIGGGFPGVAPLGATVLANRVLAADLGAATPEGFLPIDELGFGTGSFDVSGPLLDHVSALLRAAGLTPAVGPVLTVSTVTGSAARAAELAARHPGAAAEAMEGFGVATAAAAAGVPFLELRTVSNSVGPRDRAAWRIPAALDALGAAFRALADAPPLPEGLTPAGSVPAGSEAGAAGPRPGGTPATVPGTSPAGPETPERSPAP